MYIERLKRNCSLLDLPIAHKGVFDSLTSSGNTLEAIKLSIDKNIPFEIDIVQTKDDIPIVFHDFYISVNGEDVAISQLTLSELKTFTDVTTLEECIKLNNGKVPMVLDFKESTLFKLTKYRKNIISLLENYKAEYALQSFNPFFVLIMGRKLPNALRGQLVCRGKTVIDTFTMKNPESVARLYERLMSTICYIARSDYIGLEVSKSKRWNNKIEWFLNDTTDDVQNAVVEIASKVTKRPIIGWTLTSSKELKISPTIYANYIFEPEKFKDYEAFMKEISEELQKRKSGQA